jgi:hypothetical protein
MLVLVLVLVLVLEVMVQKLCSSLLLCRMLRPG